MHEYIKETETPLSELKTAKKLEPSARLQEMKNSFLLFKLKIRHIKVNSWNFFLRFFKKAKQSDNLVLIVVLFDKIGRRSNLTAFMVIMRTK